jgi:hypothetical protein
MSTTLVRIETEIVAAMKAKDASRLSALRMMKAALTHKRAEDPSSFDDATALKVLTTLAKQRRESIDAFRSAGRLEQAAAEEAELRVIAEFLPAAASRQEMEAAVRTAIAETGALSSKDIGRVMPVAQKALAGKTVDGKALSALVRELLG